MTRTDRSKQLDPARADDFAELGRRLLHAGRTIQALGDPRHASALAILAVHAAIAYADAVCVRRGGRKSSSPDHTAAVRLLRAVLRSDLPTRVERDLGRLLAEKDRLEYEGAVVRLVEAERLFDVAERVGAWAEGVMLGG